MWQSKEYREKQKNNKRKIGHIVSNETRAKISKSMSDAIINNKFNPYSRYKSGYFFSKINNIKIYYRSSYELCAYKLIEKASSIIKSWEAEPFKISYKSNKKVKNHIPDILIKYKSGKRQLIDVKALRRLKEKRNLLQIKASQRYCNKNNIIYSIWTENELGIKKGEKE